MLFLWELGKNPQAECARQMALRWRTEAGHPGAGRAVLGEAAGVCRLVHKRRAVGDGDMLASRLVWGGRSPGKGASVPLAGRQLTPGEAVLP